MGTFVLSFFALLLAWSYVGYVLPRLLVAADFKVLPAPKDHEPRPALGLGNLLETDGRGEPPSEFPKVTPTWEWTWLSEHERVRIDCGHYVVRRRGKRYESHDYGKTWYRMGPNGAAWPPLPHVESAKLNSAVDRAVGIRYLKMRGMA